MTSTSFTSSSRLLLSAEPNDENSNGDNERIDLSEDDRLYRIRIPRATGIEWGTDLSFSFVYVRDMEPSGAAKVSAMIDKGDQICELREVDETGDDANVQAIPLIGTSFDIVMNAFASLKKTTRDVDLVFFKGTKQELIDLCTNGSKDGSESESEGATPDDGKVRITVIQNKGSKDEQTKVIVAEQGANVRQTLVDEGINVYQSLTRWTNCKGKQLCGTCIVNIADGAPNTNRKSMDEASTLRDNPDSYRLSCVTFAYGDVTVETFPPVGASQWTR